MPNKGVGKDRNRSKSSNSDNASASGNSAPKVRQSSGKKEERRGRGALDPKPTRQVPRAETWTGHAPVTEGIGKGNGNRQEAADPKLSVEDSIGLRAPSGKSTTLPL